jgi:3-deoxy-D-manno-octulosonic-acid transferase
MARQIDAGLDGVVYFPIDHPWIVRRALRLFDPSLLIFLETEIWPNVLRLAYDKGIPTLMLSGRVSPRAFRRYRVFGWFFSTVMKKFTSLGMQNGDNAERIIHLGADPDKVSITGNLKQAPGVGTDPGMERGSRDIALDGKKARRVLVAGSTHRGEEEVLLDVFRILKSRIPDLLLILAPRHPQRFSEVERLLKRKSVSFEKRSRLNGQWVTWPDVIFLDTMGDLPAVYGLADVTFVGGSLVDAGGHNPMEPGRWGKPILFGPYMTNFSDIATEMKIKGGGIEVQDREELIREITALLNDPQKALRMGKQAREVTGGDHGVVDRSMSLISPFI